MVYKVDDADKLCGVTYIDWSKKYSAIPKATCEMLKQQCQDGEGRDDTFDLSCEDIQKLIKGEGKPKENIPKEDTPREEKPSDNVGGNPTNEGEKPKEPAVLTDEDLEKIIPKLSTDTTLGKYLVTPKNNLIKVEYPDEATTTEYKKEITDKAKGIPELEGYTVEVIVDKIPSPEPQVGEPLRQAPLYTKIIKITKPDGKVYLTEPMSIGTSTEKVLSILELMPKVDGKFSIVTQSEGVVTSVLENSPKQKEDFERSVVTKLKSKLPEGAVVEAVLGEPYYKKGDELLTDKDNYTLKVRVTVDGKVYEQDYGVPHIAEEDLVVTNPDEPKLNLNKVVVESPETFKLIMFENSPNILRDFVLEKPGGLEEARDKILEQLNNEKLNPLLKGFTKKVVFLRDRLNIPQIGDDVNTYDDTISPLYLITLVSPGNKVYRKTLATANSFVYISGDVDSYVRGTYG